MKGFLLIPLLFAATANAQPSVDIEMGMAVAPYVFALDDDKPFRTAGKVFLSQLTAIGGYAMTADKSNPWALSIGTNIALLCNLEGGVACGAGILAGSYVLYNHSQFDSRGAIGFTIGVASGSLVPGIVANF